MYQLFDINLHVLVNLLKISQLLKCIFYEYPTYTVKLGQSKLLQTSGFTSLYMSEIRYIFMTL